MDLFGNDNSPQAKGGRARAEVLSPESRSAIAAKAAKARWQHEGAVCKATHKSGDHPLSIAGQEIPCYVLEDGRRVLSLGGMVRSLGMSIGSASKREGDQLYNFVTQKALRVTYLRN